MPAYKYTDKYGTSLKVEGPQPPTEEILDQLFANHYESKRDIGGYVSETLAAVPRGFANSFLSMGEGLVELADAGTNLIGLDDLIEDENEVVGAIREGKRYLDEEFGADAAYRDTWANKFGEGVGSFASFFTPVGVGRALGVAGKGLTALGAGAGSLAGAGEQASRVDAARAAGIDVSQGQEDLAVVGGSIIGLSEMAPIERVLRFLPKAAYTDSMKKRIVSRLGEAFTTGGLEGGQEVLATILQDAVERNVYNENLPDSINESLWDDFTVGGAIGTLADLALRRRQQGITESEREREEELREKEKQAIAFEKELVDKLKAERAAAVTGVSDPDIPDIDPSTIGFPTPEQIGRRMATPRDYVTVQFPDGSIVQGQEKTIKRNKNTTTTQVEYVNQNNEKSIKTIATNGVPNEGFTVLERKPQETIVSSALRNKKLAGEKTTAASTKKAGDTYAHHIRTTMGMNFPTHITFKPEQIQPERFIGPTLPPSRREQGEGAAPKFAAVGTDGVQYGTSFDTVNEAAQLASSLNDQAIDQQIDLNAISRIEATKEAYDDPTKSILKRYNRRIVHPEENLIPYYAVNEAAGTITEKGFDETATFDDQINKATRLGYNKAQLENILTASQKINRDRLSQKGQTETKLFTPQEAKAILGRKFDRIADIIYFEGRESSDVEVSPVPEKVGVQDIQKILDQKNIASAIDSKEFNEMARAFVGKTGVKRMTNGERKLLAQRLAVLPSFSSPTILPDFGPKIYTADQLALATDHVQKTGDISEAGILSAAAIDPESPNAEQKSFAILKELKNQGVIVNGKVPEFEASDQVKKEIEEANRLEAEFEEGRKPMEDPARLLPTREKAEQGLPLTPKQMDDLRVALKNHMDRYGLKDIGVNLDYALRNAVVDSNGNLMFGLRRTRKDDQSVTKVDEAGNFVAEEMADPGALGYYSPVINQIFLSVDRVDPSKRNVEQISEEIIKTLDHEMIHAMRQLDLWTDKEWNSLELAARNTKKEDGETYLKWAQQTYSDTTPVVQMEEAIAEMTKDLRSSLRLGGKPRSSLERVAEFFRRLISFVRGTGYQSVNDIIENIEKGVIGGRERDTVRTLRSFEKQTGTVPERGIVPVGDVTEELTQEELDNLTPEEIEEMLNVEFEGQARPDFGTLYQRKAGVPDLKIKPEIEKAFKKLQSGKITRDQYNSVVLGTISPYDFVPKPATKKEMVAALKLESQKKKVNAPVEDGSSVGLRLDIPAYTNHGVWVPTIHNSSGTAISHMSTASITGADFTLLRPRGVDKETGKPAFKNLQEDALQIMKGERQKFPFAQIRGNYLQRTPQQNAAIARKALTSKDWTQVGFDPRRHSYFYDRTTGEPVTYADEVIQIGPLVLAKNATKNVLPTGEAFDVLYSRGPERTKTGQYVGAPAGLDSPQKLRGMRRLVEGLTKEGEPGRFWYERSGQEILDLVDGDKKEAEKIIQAIAITSANTPVATNLQYALQAYYQNKAGLPIKTGMYTTDMSKKLNNIFAGKSWEGRKTNNFYNNLMRVVDPSRVQGATIDLWMMRAFGFKGDSPTTAQYNFTEREVKRIAKKLDWEPQQVQAAIWVALKSRMESKPVKKKTEEISTRRGFMRYDIVDGKRKRVITNPEKHRQVWFSQGMKHTPTLKEREDSKFDYKDAIAPTLAQISWESIPGRTTSHMPESFFAEDNVLKNYHTDISKAFLDNDGNDIIAQRLEVLSPGDFEAPGYFEGRVSPGTQTEIAAPRKYKGEAYGETDPSAVEAISAYSAVRGILMKQDGVGWHRPYFVKNLPQKRANAIQVEIGRPFTEKETADLAKNIINLTGHKDYAPIATPDGVRLINFDYVGTSNTDFQGIINQALSETNFEGVESVNANLFAAQAGYLGNDWRNDKNGEGYLEDGFGGRPDLQRKILDLVKEIQPRIDAVDRAYAEKYGWTRNSSINEQYREKQEEVVPERRPDSEVVDKPKQRDTTPPPIPEQTLADAVNKNIDEAFDATAGDIPRSNFNAAAEAQVVANKTEATPIDENLDVLYSRAKKPNYDPDFENITKGLSAEPTPSRTPIQTYIEETELGPIGARLTKLKMAAVNKYARWEDLSSKFFANELADSSSIAALMMTDRAKAMLGSALKYGYPVYENGAVQVKRFIHKGKEYRGLIDIMAPLYPGGNEADVSLEDLAKKYAIFRRSEYLNQNPELKTPVKRGEEAAVEQALMKEINKHINPETGDPIILEWYDTWQAYNNKTIQFLKDTGMIDEAGAEAWSAASVYFPFYKQADGSDYTKGPNIFKGLTGTTDFKKVGKSDAPIDVPMLEAITRNLSAAIDMGMKNIAQQRIIRDSVELGIAREIPIGEDVGNRNVINFKVNGVRRRFEMDDPLVYESMMAMGGQDLGAFVDALAIPANFLRELVTREPGFMLANMLRDTLSAWVTSGARFVPVASTLKNFVKSTEELEMLGVVGGVDFKEDVKDIGKYIARESRKRGSKVGDLGRAEDIFEAPILKTFKTAWQWAGQATTQSDAATRKAVHDDVLRRTGNIAEAQFQALEVLNYGRRGYHPAMKMLTAWIPFLNARIQGLDVINRAARGKYSANKEAEKGKRIQTFVIRGAVLSMLTAMYYSMVSDDEEYKSQEDYVRDNNWILPTGFIKKAFGVDVKEPIKLPIPFEIGLIFKTLPERIMRSYEGEDTARKSLDALTRATTSTLEVNFPQFILPLLEAAFNHNTYTGRDIVPTYLSRDAFPALQSRFTTNELAKSIGESLNISPLKVQHVMEGYTGTLGGYVLAMADSLMREGTETMPERKLSDYPVLKRFFAKKEGKYNQAEFYDLMQSAQRASASLRKLEEDGDFEAYHNLLQAKSGLLSIKKDIDYLGDKLRDLRKQRDAILKSSMSPGLKEQLTDQINREMNYLTASVPVLERIANRSAVDLFNYP